jgi:2-C-methyl-D-erythritol 4-phosphate cytidylyltransferase
MQVTAIVLAAGAGRRIGGDVAKGFLPIAGRALVLRTLDRMFAAQTVTEVILVVAPEEIDRCRAMLNADSALRDRPCVLQSGGTTRQQSARRGLDRVGADTDMVIIHDGARPFVSAHLIDHCVECAFEKGAVIVGLPARNTVKIVGDDRLVRSTPERRWLWEIQTPQVFHKEVIIAAHRQAENDGIEVTDDAMLVERLGKPVYVLEGERTNLKITLPEDLWLAETMIREGRVP